MLAVTLNDALVGIAAILGSAGGIASAVFIGKANAAKTAADRGTAEVARFSASMAFMEAALAQAAKDNAQLRADIAALHTEFEESNRRCAADIAALKARIRALSAQIVRLGGQPEG